MKRLESLQLEQKALEKHLDELRSESQFEEKEAMAKLEEQRLLKELHTIVSSIASVQQMKEELFNQQCWIKALKFEIYKGKQDRTVNFKFNFIFIILCRTHN